MSNIVRVGSDYDQDQLYKDCERILDELGEERHGGEYPTRYYADKLIEMRSSLKTILIYYKHHDGSLTKSRVAAGCEGAIYQGAAERILMLSVRLDETDEEMPQEAGMNHEDH